ncbi:MAG: BatD family protein, partial [Myxococcales bacterium]|nr:BatD family protein [Myxococcales bacterium]
GYALGDVGRFTLQAQVSPRQAEEGGAISVRVELSGTGNLPSALAVPAREGVEWLPPDVKEDLGAIGTDRTAFGGKRTFEYVVRVRRAGAVDLGELTLPFWNPAERRYDVARAPLGTVQVTATAATAGIGAERPPDVLPNLPAARDMLDGTPSARPHWDDSPLFWVLGVASWPLAFGATVAGRAGWIRGRDAWRRRRQSPAAELRQRLSAAHAACRDGDARSADAAIARALEAAVVAHAGVSVRGALGDEVVTRLERAGIAGGAASSVADLLRECEAARFAPEAADIVAARDRWLRAQGAIRSLEKGG